MALRPNVVLSRRYRLEKRIRSSKEADVYLAYDALLHRPVTVVIPPLERVQAPGAYQAFVHRHQIASTLHHRNILAILDIGEDHDRPYVVSEHFVGDALTTIIEEEAPFVVDDVAILVEQLAHGLDYGHTRGIVHGDLAPSQVLIDSSGLAKIANLGMIEGQYLLDSASRESIESNPYLPGGLQGNTVATHALDVHTLAAIAYEMLAGRPPRGNLHPGQENGAVPERAGDVVVKGLMAYGQRSGLTALQFSQALTNWRSMTVVAPATSQRNRNVLQPQDRRGSYTLQQSWPVAGKPSTSSVESNGASSSQQAEPHSRVPRLLFLGVLIVAIAALWIAGAGDSPQDAVTSSAFPDDLLQMLQAVDE